MALTIVACGILLLGAVGSGMGLRASFEPRRRNTDLRMRDGALIASTSVERGVWAAISSAGMVLGMGLLAIGVRRIPVTFWFMAVFALISVFRALPTTLFIRADGIEVREAGVSTRTAWDALVVGE